MAIYHQYTLGQILGWLLHGWYQFVREVAPFINPAPETGKPPPWWYDYNTYWDWYGNLDENQIPNSYWIDRWLKAVSRLWSAHLEETADYLSSQVREILSNLIGPLAKAFNNFSEWITHLGNLLGEALPWWAQNALHGLQRLFKWLPEAIREGISTWPAIWESIKREVREWVRSLYDAAREWVQNNAPWVIDWLNVLSDWWQQASAWLDSFRQDPVGHVVNWLGDTWQRLVTFATGALEFWYNLWGTYADQIGPFLSDPFGWIYERAEDWILDNVW